MEKRAVIYPSRKVVLLAGHNQQVIAAIATAKTTNVKGRDITVVPHGIHETRVLNNLGFNVSSPILYYYQWPGRFAPFEKQRVVVDRLTRNPRAYNLCGLGSGKSITSLWAYDFLRSQGAVNKLLIVTPLSTVTSVWQREISRNLPHLDCIVLHGTQKQRFAKLEYPADVYIINHDGIKVTGMVDALNKRKDIDIVVIDELAEFKEKSTDRYKCLEKIVRHREYVWGLTGTPIPNTPSDAWAQCKLITPSTVPKYFGQFRDLVERKVTEFRWVPRKEALDVVLAAMTPNVRFSRDEFVELPDTTYEYRNVPLTAEQEKAYKEMSNNLVIESKEGKITACNEAVKLMKLVQVGSGLVYDGEGGVIKLDCSHRLKVTEEIILQAEGKVIVFVPLTAALNSVAEHLQKKWRVAVVHGGVGKTDREDIFSGFMAGGRGGADVLVAHPKCMSHGLSLVEASVIIWFIPTMDTNVYEQANGRITRPGQKRKTMIFHIEGTAVERKIYKRAQGKIDTQNTLLDMIRETQ